MAILKVKGWSKYVLGHCVGGRMYFGGSTLAGLETLVQDMTKLKGVKGVLDSWNLYFCRLLSKHFCLQPFSPKDLASLLFA